MAMSCLALPVVGRPTRRARRSSASVDSGISEKSTLLSGVSLPLFPARFARADDANRFRAILQPPQCIYDQKHAAARRKSQTLPSLLRRGMFKIFPIERLGIAENRRRFLEWNTMLFVVLQGLASIPGEHIYVYTLITFDGLFPTS